MKKSTVYLFISMWVGVLALIFTSEMGYNLIRNILIFGEVAIVVNYLSSLMDDFVDLEHKYEKLFAIEDTK